LEEQDQVNLAATARGLRYLSIACIIGTIIVLWVPTPHPIRQIGAGLLAFVLPGWALLGVMRLAAEDILERLALAIGLSYAATVLASLGLSYVLGHVSAVPLLGVLGLGSLAIAVASHLRGNPCPASPARSNGYDVVYLALCLSLAAGFALVNLDYADYWGDEMNGLLRAVAVAGGRVDTIFEHTKGPVEILVPASFGLLVGRFDPFTVRLPFALAHAAGIGAFYLLIRRMFSPRVALLAAALLAINGMHLAFARVVQYQTIVFLMTSLAILMTFKFFQSGSIRLLGLGAALTAVGLLAHYDVLLTLPLIAYLVWQHYALHRSRLRADWPRLVLVSVGTLSVVALFYLPFVLRPGLAETSPYLARRIGGEDWPANNLGQLYEFSALYNSIYYVGFVALLGGLQLLADLLRTFRRPRTARPTAAKPTPGRSAPNSKPQGRWRWFWLAAGASAPLIVVFVGRPDLLPLVASCAVFGVLISAGPGDIATRSIYVWFAVSFIGYVFLVDHPRTHLRLIYPPWLVLGALVVATLMRALAAPLDGANAREDGAGRMPVTQWWFADLRAQLLRLRQKPVAIGVIVGLCLLFVLFAGYQYLLFVDTRTEYFLTYPEHKSSLYWEDPNFPFGSRRPYGAPHRLGWQMVNQLFLGGTLEGDWDSNDSGSNLFWYTLGWPRNACYPRYYFATEFQQKGRDADAAPPAFSMDYYARIGQVWNRDRLQMDVYEFAPQGVEREPVIWSEPSHYDSFVTPADFRTLPYTEPVPVVSTTLSDPAVFRPGPVALEQIAAHYGDARITGVQDKVALIGYDLDERWTGPGGVVVVTLYWQALDVVNLPYKVFVHLQEAEGRTWAQADDLPACGTRSTQAWRVGQLVADRHVVPLPIEIPTGEYVLRVGLYEPQTELRMDRLDAMGNPQGTDLAMAIVQISP
jgi:hypothetical protein